MKKWLLAISLAFNAWFIWQNFAAREKWAGDYKVKTIGRFSIMTNTREKDSYIIAMDDGRSSWTIDGNRQCINEWKVADFTIWLDEEKNRIKSTLLEFTDGQGKTVYYADVNGDGIIDKRTWLNPHLAQYFIGGQFYDAETKDGKNYIFQDGERNEVDFQGGRWTLKRGPSTNGASN